MNDDPGGPIVSVEPGDPVNDQMLAQTREDLRGLLDITIHPMIEQGEMQDADMSSMMAALVMNWLSNPRYMPRARLASNLALALFLLAKDEREITEDGKTVKRD